ncbi:methyltransferase domain-containing protein [Rhizobium sp. MHM7A]|nr:methyltransferase domain-containing protein [Rhizobium sp. MHM7A]
MRKVGVMSKLLFILPSGDYCHSAVFHRLTKEALASGMEAEILAEDVGAITEACEGAQALIGDVVTSGHIMQQVKAAHPHLAVIGIYASEQGASINEAIDDTYSNLLKYRCTMMLGLLPSEEASANRSLVITGERGIKPSNGLDEGAKSFIDLLRSRVGNRHHRTELTLNGLPDCISGDLAETIRYTEVWAKWSLFPKYESRDPRYPGAEFGFIAKRTNVGTLITARASNKERPGVDDFTLITDIGDDGTVHVRSSKRKASLNAPLAHRILQERPEINYVVHSHVFLPEGVTVPDLSTPGTFDDWKAVAQAVHGGARIVNQPHHGTLILLRDPEELLPLLKENSLYRHNSDLYDLAYARFQSAPDKPTSLERAIGNMTLPNQAKVLDLCCGTGASTLALQNLGLKDVDFADGSPSMLAVAERRLGRRGKVAELEDLGNIPARTYDLVTVRQAFAYVEPENLDKVARNIACILKPSGRFVFNSFAQIPSGAAKARDIETELDNILIRTREDNRITDDDVLHTQRTEIIDFDKGRWDAVLDVNQFYQHAPDRLREAFLRAGLSFDMQQYGNSICYVIVKPQHGDHIIWSDAAVE